jgi:hypothetical protein
MVESTVTAMASASGVFDAIHAFCSSDIGGSLFTRGNELLCRR